MTRGAEELHSFKDFDAGEEIGLRLYGPELDLDNTSERIMPLPYP